MREIRTSGLMSGEGKRGDAETAQATAPLLDSTLLRLWGLNRRRVHHFSAFFQRIDSARHDDAAILGENSGLASAGRNGRL